MAVLLRCIVVLLALSSSVSAKGASAASTAAATSGGKGGGRGSGGGGRGSSGFNGRLSNGRTIDTSGRYTGWWAARPTTVVALLNVDGSKKKKYNGTSLSESYTFSFDNKGVLRAVRNGADASSSPALVMMIVTCMAFVAAVFL